VPSSMVRKWVTRGQLVLGCAFALLALSLLAKDLAAVWAGEVRFSWLNPDLWLPLALGVAALAALANRLPQKVVGALGVLLAVAALGLLVLPACQNVEDAQVSTALPARLR
jgi:hypothetical protein